jgi:hypothetical protein
MIVDFGEIFVAFLVLAIAQFVGFILALVDLVRREDPDVVGNSRVLRALIVLFIPFGWVAYFVAGRR